MATPEELAYAAGIIDGDVIAPYLVIKQRQAQLLVAYRMDTRLDHTRYGGQGVRVPPDELAIKRDYVARIRLLNQRSDRGVV